MVVIIALILSCFVDWNQYEPEEDYYYPQEERN